MLFSYIGVPMKFCGNLFVGTTIKLHHKVFLIHLANGSSGLNFGQARCYSRSIPVKYIPNKSRTQENECAYRDLPFLKYQNEKNEAAYFVDNEEHNGLKMDLSKVDRVENSQSFPNTAETSSHVSLGGFNPGIEVDGTIRGQGRLRNGFKMDLSKVHKVENSPSYAKSQTSSHVSLGGFNPGIEVDGTTRGQGRLHNGFKMDLSKVHKVENSQSYPKAQTSSHVSQGGFNPDIEVDGTTRGQGRLHNVSKMDLSKVHRVENAQSYLNTAETNSHVSLGGLNPDIQVDGTTRGQGRLHNGFKMDLSKVHIVEYSKSYLGTAETSSHVSLGGFNPDFEVDGTTMSQGRLHNGFKMDLSKVRRVENSESYLNIAENGSHVSLGGLNPDIDVDGTRGQGRLHNGFKMDLSKVHRVENSESYLNTETSSHVSLGGLNPDIEVDGTTRGQGRMHNGLKMDLSKVHSVESSESYRSTAETSSHVSLGGLNPDIEVDDRIIWSNENGTIRDQGKLEVERTAIKLLGIRAYTAIELKKKLEQKKFLPGIIDAVVRNFQDKGLINDGLYAEMLSRSRWCSSSWGPGRIKQALMEKGVSEVDVQKAIKLIFADEASGELDLELGMSKTSFDELYARTSKQWRRSENAPRHTRISRIVHWLQYRGYNMGVVKNMLKRLESTAEL